MATADELGRYNFYTSLKSVPPEVDIFEVFIPAGLESRYSVNPASQVQRVEDEGQPAAATDSETQNQDLSPLTGDSQGHLWPEDSFPAQSDVDLKILLADTTN